MKLASSLNRQRGFTLIELLVVIAIIGILAGLLLPAIAGVKTKAKVKMAQVEMKSLASAISAYETTYSRLPATNQSGINDFSFGVSNVLNFTAVGSTNALESNSNIVIVLMDVDLGINAGHLRNAQQHVFLDPKNARSQGDPGVSTVDYQYRDPWGHPYIISLDMNYDDHVEDAIYSKLGVSQTATGSAQGLNGLVNQYTDPVSHAPQPNTDHFALAGSVMVWSLGPDGQADGSGNIKATEGVNKDNILSWQ